MRRRYFTGVVAVVAAAAVTFPAGAAVGIQQIGQVNPAGEVAPGHIFPHLVANPQDASHLVLADVKRTSGGSTFGTCMVYVSRDGGGSWTGTALLVPTGKECRRFPAPKVAFGKGGAVFAAYYVIARSVQQPYEDPTGAKCVTVGSENVCRDDSGRPLLPSWSPQGQLLVARSDNGGASFGGPVTVATLQEHLATDLGYALNPSVANATGVVQNPGGYANPLLNPLIRDRVNPALQPTGQQVAVNPIPPDQPGIGPRAGSGQTVAQDIALATDLDPTSPGFGNLYLAWNVGIPVGAGIGGQHLGISANAPRPVWVSRSTDGGANFGRAVPVLPPPHEQAGRNNSLYPPALAVSQGRVFVAAGWSTCANVYEWWLGGCWWFRLVHTSSTDFGASFAPAQSVPDAYWAFYNFSGGRSVRPSLAADPSDSRKIYIAYESEDLGDLSGVLLLVRSTDGGATWSAPARIHDDPPDAEYAHERPALSVAPNGRLDALWYDGRNDPDSMVTCDAPGPSARDCSALRDVYYTYSTDGGATFAPNIRVNTAPFNAADRVIFGRAPFGGMVDAHLGTIAVVSTDSGVTAVWEQSTAPLSSAWSNPRAVLWNLKAASITVS